MPVTRRVAILAIWLYGWPINAYADATHRVEESREGDEEGYKGEAREKRVR